MESRKEAMVLHPSVFYVITSANAYFYRYIQRNQVVDINAFENWLPEDFNFEEHYHKTKGAKQSDNKKRKMNPENETNNTNNNKVRKNANNTTPGSTNPPQTATKKVVSSNITPITTSSATITSPIMSPEEKAILRERQLHAAENRKNNFQQSGILSKKIQKKTVLGTSTNNLMSPNMWDQKNNKNLLNLIIRFDIYKNVIIY